MLAAADRQERAHRSLVGLHAGDCFGELFAQAGPARECLARRETPAWTPWRYTDDSVQAAVLTAHLIRRGGVHQDDLVFAFAKEFDASPHRGYGAAARDLLIQVRAGVPWRPLVRAAFKGMGSLGNGAAMRVAPLGAYFSDDLEQVGTQAALSAETTHANRNAVAGAVAVALAAAGVALERPSDEVWRIILDRTPDCLTRDALARAANLPAIRSTSEAAATLGTGARACADDTVPFALWVALRHRDSYVDAIWEAVSGLGDCDTICAIAGGVVAASALASARPPEAWTRRAEPLPVVIRTD